MAVDDSYTKVLLHCDGTNGSTTFIDEAGHTCTAQGNAKLSTSQKYFGTAAYSGDGSGDYVSLTDSTDFSPGTQKFTIDCWIYQSAVSNYGAIFEMRLADNNTVADLALLSDWGGTRDMVLYGVGTDSHSGLNVLPLTTWVHVAVVGNGGASGSRNIKVYMSGNLIITKTGDYNLTNNRLWIGEAQPLSSPTRSFNGYIDEFRYSLGIERWTTNFTPPTSPYGPSSSTPIFYPQIHTIGQGQIW